MKNNLFWVAVACLVSACALQRAQIAQDAQNKMVGLSKEQVLACMGVPVQKSAEGSTEVWVYHAGDGSTTVTGTHAYGIATATASSKYCIINVVITGGNVSQVNYSGPTGGPITGGEQCAYAVQSCVR